MCPSIPELLKKIPEFTERAELHDKITVKILEIVDSNSKKIEEILTHIKMIHEHISVIQAEIEKEK